MNRLESVNKFAAKICTKRWSGPSSLSHLGWLDLSTHRKIQKLMICRRILHNHSIIPPLAAIVDKFTTVHPMDSSIVPALFIERLSPVLEQYGKSIRQKLTEKLL